MAIYKQNIIDIDLNTGNTHRSFMDYSIGEGDWLSNRFGFRCYRDGEPESIAGSSCMGYFIRSDGTTVVVNGMVSGNVAVVELPKSCYVVDGDFSLVIKLSDGTRAATIRVVDGTVLNTTTERIIDPGTVVPSLESLTAIVNRIEAAADVIDGISISQQQIAGTRYRIVVTKS